MKEVLTVCPFCGCGCGIYLTGENGIIARVTPSLSNPVSKGSLCIKGWHISEVFTSPNRIQKPLIKVNGSFKEISWEEAFELISLKFNSIKDKENSFGIIGSSKFSNEDSYTLHKFARQIIKTNNIDSSFTLHYAPLIERLNDFDFYVTINDIENSDLIIIIGSNITVEAPQIARRVLKAYDKGAKVVVINSLKIPFSSIASIYIQPVPEELSVLIETLGKIINKKSYDKSNSNIFKLEEIASLYVKAQNPVCICGEDVFKGVKGGASFSSIFEIFKHRLFPLFTINNIIGAISFGVSPYVNEKKGLNIIEMLNASLEGSIKCLYIIGEDILLSAGDYNRTREALEKLEFLVVQDLFLTETALLADVVLPACSSLEKKGSFINMEGSIQPVLPVLKPLGDSKPDWQIFTELSEKLGNKLFYKDFDEITKEIEKINFLKNKKFLQAEVSHLGDVISDEFPLWAKVDNSRLFFHTGTLLKNSSTLMREIEQGTVIINSEYAKENDIRNNEKVKIISKRGEIIRNAVISDEVLKNIILVRGGLGDFSSNVILPFGLKWTTVRLEKSR